VFAFVVVERLDASGGDIGEAAVERRERLFIERWATGVGGVLQVLQQEAGKFGLILRQFIDEGVKGFLGGHRVDLDILIITS
jgi:hypothetical protein